MADAATTATIIVVLRGYFSRHIPEDQRLQVLSLDQAATPRAVIAHLLVPPGAVGLLLVNREQVTMDTPLHAGDTLEILPLLGGGCT